jgi:hypothetical protein
MTVIDSSKQHKSEGAQYWKNAVEARGCYKYYPDIQKSPEQCTKLILARAIFTLLCSKNKRGQTWDELSPDDWGIMYNELRREVQILQAELTPEYGTPLIKFLSWMYEEVIIPGLWTGGTINRTAIKDVPRIDLGFWGVNFFLDGYILEKIYVQARELAEVSALSKGHNE